MAALSFLFANAFVVLLFAGWRFGEPGMRHFVPPLTRRGWLVALVVLGAATVATALAGRRALATRAAARAAPALLVYPLGLACVWWAIPADPHRYGTADVLLLGGLVLAFALLFWRDRRAARTWGLTRRGFGPAVAALRLPTALLLGATAATGLVAGFEFRPAGLLVALATYPFYAAAQLLVLQILLLRQLERLAPPRWLLVGVLAGFFALVHWPNGPLMAGTFFGAAMWMAVFLRHGNLPAIALSMGLAAATMTNVLPRERLLQNVRSGPIFVERLLEGRAGR